MAAVAYQYEGEGTFSSLPRFRAECDRTFIVGALYRLEELKDRSQVSHNHEFAWLNEAWKNLPEDIADDYPTSEHLRKRALIHAGYFDETAVDAGSKAAALRFASMLKSIDDFALVIVRGQYVIRRTARSQSKKAMGAKDFQESKTAIMEIVAGMIGVAPDELRKAA